MKRKFVIFFAFVFIGILYSTLHYSFYRSYHQVEKLSSEQKKEIYYSEGAFYYSFYNKIISAQTLRQGLFSIFFNDQHESPRSINAHKRFNITYEIFSGIIYRFSQLFLSSPPDPTQFYDRGVFFFNGFLLSFIAAIAFILTGSLWSMLLPVSLFISHHQEASRLLMNTPLRENIGIVFVVAHFFIFYWVLKSQDILTKIKSSEKLIWPFDHFQTLFIIATFGQLIFWQFTQFVLIVEIIAVLTLFVFKHISKNKLFDYFILLITSWFLTVIYLMGSAFVLNSLFFFISISFLLALAITAKTGMLLNSQSKRLFFCALTFSFGILIHFTFNVFLDQQNDAHIFNFIVAQFQKSTNFHALLYLCDDAFNKMSGLQIKKLFGGGYLLFYLISLGLLVHKYGKKFFFEHSKAKTRTYLYYLLLLSVGFSIIAFSSRRFSILALPVSLPLISFTFFLISQK